VSVLASQRRGLVLLLGVSVLTQVVTFVARPTATYRAIELEVPAAWLGALAASFAVVPLVLALPSGALTDRLGERRVAVLGGVVLCLGSGCFVLFGTSVVGLVLGSVLLGTGHLFCVVAQQALVANTATPGRFDAAFGRYTFAASLGQALGPGLIIIFGGDQEIPRTDTIFLVAAAICVVLTVLSVGVGSSHQRGGSRREKEPGDLGTLLRLPGLPRALLTSCVILAAVDLTLVYLPALGAEHGLTSRTVGLLLALRAASSMVSRLLLGRLSAMAGRRRLLVISTLVAAGSTALVPIPMPLPLVAVAVILMGLGLGVGQPVTMAWLAEASPPGLRGRSMSLRLVGNRTGQLLIPSAIGAVAVGLGSAGVLWVTAAALAAVAAGARRITETQP
jgi:MFS family permease